LRRRSCPAFAGNSSLPHSCERRNRRGRALIPSGLRRISSGSCSRRHCTRVC
jgi:hypothetical protein